MKISSSWSQRGFALLGVCTLVAVLAGCGSTRTDEPVFSDAPAGVGSGTAAPAVSPTGAPPTGSKPSLPLAVVGRFRVGDIVKITFSGIEPPPQPHEERIKEDGTITLPMIGSVLAANKTPGELQKEIQAQYSKFYVRLIATVQPLDQAYFVGGEVKSPGSKLWFGEITVTQAIQSAGDFTDYANKRKVQLIRADGTKIIVNCKEVLKHPELDPKVLPKDKIHVPRSLW
jgi:polysaccharide export outer membrane protein